MQFMALHWHSVLQVLDTLKIWHPMQPGMISFKCFSLFLIKKCEKFWSEYDFFSFYQKRFDFHIFQFQITGPFFKKKNDFSLFKLI